MLNLILKTVKKASRSRISMLARTAFLKMKIPMDFPLILNVDPTNACNLLCEMCPNSQSPVVKKNFMDMGLYKKILDEVQARGKRLYRFFLVKDGEPLLHKNIVEMVDLAKRKNISHITTVVTNGVFLDREKQKAFVDLGLDIKRASPFATTLVIELCQDAPGYIPTKKAFAEGSYETVNSRIAPGGGEKMAEVAIRLLKELGTS